MSIRDNASLFARRRAATSELDSGTGVPLQVCQEPEPKARDIVDSLPEWQTRRDALAIRSGKMKLSWRDIRGNRENLLAKAYQAGDRYAGEILLHAHHPLFLDIAKKSKKFWHDLSVEDMVAEAQIGFLKGVSRFDTAHESGSSLYWYAKTWAIQGVQRASRETGVTIRVPNKIHETGFNVGRYADCARLVSVCARLDEPIKDGEMTLVDILPAHEEPADERVAADEMLHGPLALAMSNLSPIQSEVLTRRANGETLSSIAVSVGLSGERIRQIESSALRAARVAAGSNTNAPVPSWGQGQDAEKSVKMTPALQLGETRGMWTVSEIVSGKDGALYVLSCRCGYRSEPTKLDNVRISGCQECAIASGRVKRTRGVKS